jgi:tetratricopeptide (TPR) repeat protein
MSGLKRLVVEIHRRSLWQVLLIYCGASWVVLEVSAHVVERYLLPEWSYGAALMVLLLGLPIVLATAFVQESGELPRPVEAEVATQRVVRQRRFRMPKHLTWPRALLGVGGTLAVLAIVAVAVVLLGGKAWVTEAYGEAGDTFDRRDDLVVADFEGPAVDPGLAPAVREALMIDLQQSDYVEVFGSAQVRAVLQRMEVSDTTRLDEELAREVAEREGLAAVLVGTVSMLGQSYSLTARVIEPATGKETIAVRVTADPDRLVLGVEKLSREIRARLGEEMSDIQRGPRLPRLTTRSLSALKKYAQGNVAVRRSEYLDAAELFEEAIALDSGFVYAYRSAGVMYGNLGRRSKARDLQTRAYELRRKLPDRERYQIEAVYYSSVKRDHPAAIRTYKRLVDSYPDNSVALNNLAYECALVGDFECNFRYARRGVEICPECSIIYTNAFEGAVGTQRWAVADSLARASGRASAAVSGWLVQMSYLETGKWTEAASINDSLLSADQAPTWLRLEQLFAAATLATLRGRPRESLDWWLRYCRVAENHEQYWEYLRGIMNSVFTSVALLDDTLRARSVLAEAERAHPAAELEGTEPSLAAWLYGRAHILLGDIAVARAYADGDYWQKANLDHAITRKRLLAELAVLRGSFEEALELDREVVESSYGYARFIDQLIQAQAFDGLGQGDSAIYRYETAIDAYEGRYAGQLWMERFLYRPLLHYHLGGMYSASGDRVSAARHYRAFLDLWSDPEPELLPRVEAAERSLAELGAEAGGQ